MTTAGTEDNFRPEFKRYKGKNTPSFQNVVDVDVFNRKREQELNEYILHEQFSTPEWKELVMSVGLTAPQSWRCYTAHGYPGLHYIRNPFQPVAQRYWVKRCIADYPSQPNITNLEAHSLQTPRGSPWQTSQQKLRSASSKEKSLMDQLRWVTLGYHYDWNNKVYHQDRHSAFPDDLALVSALIAVMLGYDTFQSQAAIVNFYHMDSTLGGHVDRSEFDLSAPLISYSLGQSAILLVGGQTKATKPLALHIRSGDVIILGGASRLAYHAVPRIMHATQDGLPECFVVHNHEHSERGDTSQVYATCISSRDTEEPLGKGERPEIEKTGREISKISHETKESSEKTNVEDSYSAAKRKNVLPEESTSDNSSVKEKEESIDSLSSVFISNMSAYHQVIENMSAAMNNLMKDEVWGPFEEYLKNARINMSVRQVTGPGKGFPAKEEGIGRCDDHTVICVDTKRTKTDHRS